MNNINFKAKFINESKIQRFNPIFKRYFPKSVSILKLDYNNQNDIQALLNIVENWQNKHFIKIMTQNAFLIANNFGKTKNIDFYLLSTQKNNFETLDSNCILGMAQIEKLNEKKIIIDYLETSAENQFLVKNRKFRFVGTELLNFFKKRYEEIKLISLENMIDFYKANGFILEKNETDMIWKQNEKSNLKLNFIQKFVQILKDLI